MAKETAEERRIRIQKEVEERSKLRTQQYFEAQAAAKAAAATIAKPLPAADAYTYDYAWRQDVGAPTGELKLIKNVNPYYSAATNTITDPVTGERTNAVPSTWSGPTSFRGDGSTVTDPYAGLTPEQKAARQNAEEVAAKYGLSIDPKTGMIIKPPANYVIDPVTGKYTDPSKLSKPGKTETGRKTNADGSITITYSDGTTSLIPAPGSGNTGFTGAGNGNTGSGNNGSASTDAYTAFLTAEKKAADTLRRQSAFDVLKKEFEAYGLGSLVEDFKALIFADASPEEVVLKIRATPAYQKRFAGNKIRLDAGLNVYDEATYLDLENAFEEAFTAYGVLESAGDTIEKRRAMYSTFIGGTVSPNEVKGRIQLATVAANEDAITKATLKELYPMISDSDVVSYFLNPKETLPKLETKVRAAQIGAAAVRQGLVTNVNTAEELAAMGITEQRAEEVYSAYASMKPRLDLLSGLEKDTSLAVNQQVAEDAFLRGLASEQRKIEQLRQKELSRFTGSSGAARNVSLSRGTGGQI